MSHRNTGHNNYSHAARRKNIKQAQSWCRDGRDVAWLHSDQWVVSGIATQTWNFSLAKYDIYCAQDTFPCFSHIPHSQATLGMRLEETGNEWGYTNNCNVGAEYLTFRFSNLAKEALHLVQNPATRRKTREIELSISMVWYLSPLAASVQRVTRGLAWLQLCIQYASLEVNYVLCMLDKTWCIRCVEILHSIQTCNS